MAEKTIDFPEPVKFMLPTDQGEKEFTTTFTEFLSACLKGYEEFKKGPENARRYDQIMDVIESVNGEKQITFGSSDFGLVSQAVKSAEWLYADANRAYLPFYDAVANARDVTTEAKKKLDDALEKKEK
jgi:hypothetical protein